MAFSRLAEEYQLVLRYRKEFHDMYTEFSEHSEFGPLMTRMQVIDGQGESKMDEEQWEAASEYDLSRHTVLANVAPRYLHWVYLRETIVVSSSPLCSARFALLFRIRPCCLLQFPLYILIPFASPDTNHPLFGSI